MKEISLGRLRTDTRTLRLAATYLAIIMLLSISFSFIFYRVSTRGFQIRVHRFDGGGISFSTKDDGALPPPPSTVAISGGASSGQFPGSAKNEPDFIPGLNTQLEKRFATIKQSLFRRLVLLNIGALLVGGALSYYLARRTLKPMEAAIEMQSRFATDASHELRTPLTVMQTEIEVALKKPKLSAERAKTALESNYQEVMRLRQLTEGLLSLTPGGGNDNFAEVELDEIVSQAVNRMLKPALLRQMTVTDNVPKLKVQGDAPSLVQALSVLLDNAIKYGPVGSAVYIEGRAEGKRAYLSVRDAGPGIRAMDLPHIFERFYRAQPARSKESVKGYGLGLSIAQVIVKQHHGKLSVTSKLGKGSTFTIELPAIASKAL